VPDHTPNRDRNLSPDPPLSAAHTTQKPKWQEARYYELAAVSSEKSAFRSLLFILFADVIDTLRGYGAYMEVNGIDFAL